MSETDLPAREAMEFDVVIVGAGPAGLSAAIRLKQLNPELGVVVVEKGSEVGAHILSGAVIDPIGLDRLLPEWRSEDTPIKTPVTDDRFYWLGPAGGLRLPNFLLPPLMSNHGNYIVSLGNVCRWLATKAEGLGVEIYPGFAAAEVLYGERGEVVGVATGDMGIGKDGKHKEGFARGMELRGKYTLFAEGARGSLSKQLISRFELAKDREPQKFGIGLKELWKVAPEKHKPGLVQHSFGWPLGDRTGGGSFLYHLEDGQVVVGFVVHLNYRNPYIAPFEEFQRFKQHPLIRPTFEGGKRISYGARAITEGGWQSVPKLTFPGGALIGCAAGFINLPRIKGSHNAILSGMQAAEHVAAALAEGRVGEELDRLRKCMAFVRDRPRPEKGAQRQAVLVETWHHFGLCLRGPRYVDQYVRLFAVRHAAARQAGFGHAGAGREAQADRLSEARRRRDVRQALIGVPVEHQPRGGPAGPSHREGHGLAEVVRARRLCRPVRALLSGRRLRVDRGAFRPALPDQRAELRPLQNLRHQGPEPEHHLGHARGRRRAELPEHVIGNVSLNRA